MDTLHWIPKKSFHIIFFLQLVYYFSNSLGIKCDIFDRFSWYKVLEFIVPCQCFSIFSGLTSNKDIMLVQDFFLGEHFILLCINNTTQIVRQVMLHQQQKQKQQKQQQHLAWEPCTTSTSMFTLINQEFHSFQCLKQTV